VTPFLVLGMPRSRTFWTSRYLAYTGRVVEHDPSRRFRARSDIARYFAAPGAAAVDTALGIIWHEIAATMPPDLRIAVLHRPVADVRASLDRLGVELPDAWLRHLACQLEAIDGLHIEANELDREPYARALFEHCLNRPFDRVWWESLRDVNLQCDRASYLSDMRSNLSGISAVFGRQSA